MTNGKFLSLQQRSPYNSSRMKEALPLSLRDRNRLRTRQELLNAVLDLFAEGGVAACSVDAVAKRLGASKTTVYSYFPGGLDEMLRDIYRMISQRVLTQGIELREAQSRTEDRIYALAKSLLDVCAEPKIGFFYMLLSPALNALLEPVVGEASSQFRKMITCDLITLGQSESRAAYYSILITGSLREAAITVARDATQRDPLLEAIALMTRALIAMDN
ncbi:UNVERIFIED_ORG: AcrR family transcriptional regulator [Pseudomonas putida]|nr:AcrR family transcriptional regulator [Pseudomonas putida]